MKKVLVIIVVILALIVGIQIGFHMPHDIEYAMDRVEDGIGGQEWAVIEVYDASTNEIAMVDILVCE